MKRLLVILLITMLVMPVMPLTAQDDVVVSRLEEYNENLPQGYGVISVEDLLVKMVEEDVFLLDVRQPEEYEAGHIPEAVSVPLRTLGENLDILPSIDAQIVVICKGGFRAMIGMTALQVLGYEHVFDLKGGYDAWVAEELDFTTEPTEAVRGDVPEFDPVLLEAVNNFLANIPEGWGAVRSPDLAAELVDNPPVLIDVRSLDEWNTVGYIEGAQHIWINELMANRDLLPEDKDTNIVVYCASSYRGGIAYVTLNLLGYTNVRNLSGGINAWIAAELPVVGAAEIVAEFDAQTYAADYIAALPNSFNAVRVEDLAAKIEAAEDFILLDVRTVDEYAEGFIQGAINIPLPELTAHLDMLPNFDADIVIYCGSGHRSALAMAALNMLGYTNAQSLLGGARAWMDSDLPITTEEIMVEASMAPEIDPALYAMVETFITNIPAGYYAVKAADLNTELVENPPVLIDVRTDSEWEAGFIEGAIHIPLRDLMTRFDELPTDMSANIIFYGSTSHRGALAMTVLRMLGYENVRSLGGGTGAWAGAELPLAAPATN